MCPRKCILLDPNIHFCGFSFKLKCLNRSKTFLRTSMCSEKSGDLVKISMSSTYDITESSNPDKTLVIALQKTEVAFFKPNGICVI
ncbi:unnamed protein product [Meloidogyne enterolobii]|uniref:Uncharacterized protein n=1 Tax=Meloidogyne enterolobii TaxID=390850 RepID=A0ACB0ZLT0_MELEN